MKSAYFKYIFGLFLFGSNGIVASYIDLNSYEIVLLRTFIGSFLLIVFFFASKEKFTFYAIKNSLLGLLSQIWQWEQAGYFFMRLTQESESAFPHFFTTAVRLL